MKKESNKRVDPFSIVKKQKLDIKKEGKSTVVATKISTRFEPDNTGYNRLESLTHCPICNIQMQTATLTTADGREIPITYCLQHRISLPLPLDNTKGLINV